MSLSKDVVIRLLGDSSSAEKAIKAAANEAEVSVGAYRRAEREHTKQAKAMEAAAQKQREAMESVGRGAMIMGAVIAAGLGLAAKAAIDWESAWAGVMKTVEGGPEEMAALERELRNLATTLPATHEEIAAVAEAAGQLGIARQDIAEFTKVAIAMGVSTNLSAEEAATGMARMANIMGTASSDVDRMGSALVAVGNAGASTEAEILNMSLRIAAAGRQAGFSEGEVLGLANAMSSLGIESEAGGTAISTVIKTIGNAVSDGGEELEKFARIAGVSSSQFAKAWRDDAAGALTMVVAGLGRMQAQGENVNGVIDDLGLGGIRTSDTLLRLAGNADGLADSLALGNKAWAENSALMNEANQRYETTAARLQMARNQINDAAIDIGGTLLPVLASGAEMVANFARGFQELPDWMKDTVTVLGALAATIGLVGGAAIIAVPKVAAFRATMHTLADSSGLARTGMGKFGLFMTGPWGAAIGVATMAIGGLITWLGSSSRASEEAAGYQRDLASALRETGGVIDDTVRALAAQKAEDYEIGTRSLLEVAEELGVALPTVTDALLGQRGAYDEAMSAADAYLQTALELANFNTEDPSFVAAMDRVNGFKGALEDLGPQMGEAVAENERLAAAAKESGEAAAGSVPGLEGAADAAGGLAEDTEAAATAVDELIEVLDTLNNRTLSVRDATRNYQEAIDSITEAMGAEGFTNTLDINTEAGRANSEMLDELAVKAFDQAEAILRATGNHDQFSNSVKAGRQQLFETAMQFYKNEDAAWAYVDSVLAVPDEAVTDIKLPTYLQVRQQLIDVHDRVKGIPPQTWTNVGVLSAQAIQQLENVGYKTRTLPDGTVEVTASTWQAEQDLNHAARTRYSTIIATEVLRATPRTSGSFNYGGGRASGGAVGAGQVYLVGEKGPELMRFGQSGYVTPADQTAQILAAIRQPAPDAPALAFAGAGPVGSSSSSTSYSRTYAPNVTVRTSQAIDERRLITLLADEEFLHG